MTGQNLTENKKVFFDLYKTVNGSSIAIGSYSIDADKLESIDTKAICQYILKNYTEFFKNIGRKNNFYICDSFYGCHAWHILENMPDNEDDDPEIDDFLNAFIEKEICYTIMNIRLYDL